MVELKLEIIYSPFSSAYYFGYHMKDKVILKHLNYIHRQRLLFFWTTFGTLFNGDSNFFRNLTKNGRLNLLYLK